MSESGPGDLEERLAAVEQRQQQLAQRPAGKPGRDWDAYAAVIASFIGLLALGVSGYTARVQRQQLRAQVWPHLAIWESTVGDKLGLYVGNQGTGPARISKVRMIVNGAAARTWKDVQRAADFTDEQGLTRSTLGGVVLPAGKDYAIAQPLASDASRAKFGELLFGEKHAVSIAICYCSVLDECWVAGFGVRDDDPVHARLDGPSFSADDCPIDDAARFKE